MSLVASISLLTSQSTDMLLCSHKPDTVIWEDATLSSRSRGGKKLSGSSGGHIGVQVILICDWSTVQNTDLRLVQGRSRSTTTIQPSGQASPRKGSVSGLLEQRRRSTRT